MSIAPRILLLLATLTTLAGPRVSAAQQAPRITISVDARAPWTPRIPVRMTIPATAGPLTLAVPRWLPGMHAPEAPLGNFARLRLTVDGAALAWERDAFNPYLIHLTVPEGAKSVEASYDYVPKRRNREEVFYGVAASQHLAVLNPAAFSLAPQGDSRALAVAFTIRLPKGWSAATALRVAAPAAAEADGIAFSPVSLYTLVDSPIMAGQYRRSIPLATPKGDVPHTLELFAETDEVLAAKAPVTAGLLTRLVAESGRMFGTRHYQSFRFMLALTTDIGRNGLEHHEGVAYVLQPDDLDPGKRQLPESEWPEMLIPHEYTHSWNGKFRRPYGEDAHSNGEPQSADLIWVYEGLTEYLSDVLMVRSGFRSFEGWRRDLLARIATVRFGTGEDWQTLADTALVAPYTYVQGTGTGLRGVNDIYYESEMIWLEADAIIRRESKGARSLDDFCRLFFRGPNRGAEVVRYTRQDVVDALNRTQPYDWSGFIQRRFYAPPNGLPTAGVEAAGWKVTFGDAPVGSPGRPNGLLDYRHTFGAGIGPTGRVADVQPGSIA